MIVLNWNEAQGLYPFLVLSFETFHSYFRSSSPRPNMSLHGSIGSKGGCSHSYSLDLLFILWKSPFTLKCVSSLVTADTQYSSSCRDLGSHKSSFYKRQNHVLGIVLKKKYINKNRGERYSVLLSTPSFFILVDGLVIYPLLTYYWHHITTLVYSLYTGQRKGWYVWSFLKEWVIKKYAFLWESLLILVDLAKLWEHWFKSQNEKYHLEWLTV